MVILIFRNAGILKNAIVRLNIKISIQYIMDTERVVALKHVEKNTASRKQGKHY